MSRQPRILAAAPAAAAAPAPAVAASVWGVLLVAACWLALVVPPAGASSLNGTLCLNACSGHGQCTLSSDGPTCNCYDGWGSAKDVTSYRAPDCSSKTCPLGSAWAWVATSNVSAHSEVVECSNKGICDHTTGLCQCVSGFMGPACERWSCPNDCSGHGQCLSMKVLATHADGMPLSRPTSYSVHASSGINGLNKAWDDDMIYGCLCDSSWPVGLGSGQSQASEWFGPDCSQRHCPSADDPVTTSVNETNCFNVTAAGGHGVGLAGNLCHVDCANRGICNYDTGTCSCFAGHYGLGCNLQHTEWASSSITSSKLQ